MSSPSDALASPTAPPPVFSPPRSPQLKWGVASLAAAADRVPWLWQGFLAPGAVTLMTSQWKSGKTTLASLILAQMKAGGTVAGLPVAAGQALVISEESEERWRDRCGPLGIVDHVGWYCRPFPGRLSREAWCDLLDQAARGSGALSAHADIVLEMGGGLKAAEDDRRRRLRAFSRYPETPRHFAMELNAEGTDYRAIDLQAPTVTAVRRQELTAVLESAPTKLPLIDILTLWPAGREPDPVTLQRWLNRALAEGVVSRDGSGRRHDPYRYWLLGQEERWLRETLGRLDQEPLPAPEPEAGKPLTE